MKPVLIIVTAALLTATPLCAKEAVKPAAQSETTTASPDAEATASTRPSTDLSAVMAAIEANDNSVEQVPTITHVSKVAVVRISDLEGASAAKAEIDTALDTGKAHVGALQAAIAANPALKAELDEQKVAPSSVVAARVEADGSVTVFLR